MRKKRKTIRDLSMYLFSHEEMKGTHVPEPPMEQGAVPETKTVTKKEEKEEDTPLDNHNTSFEIDSRILTKEMFFAILHLKRLDVNQVRMLAMEMAMVWQNGKNLNCIDRFFLQGIFYEYLCRESFLQFNRRTIESIICRIW